MDHRRSTNWSLVPLFFAVLTLTLPSECTSKRVLFYQGIAVGYSHQVAISPMLDLLASHGHSVTIFSPYKYIGSAANVTQVYVDHFKTINKGFSEQMNHMSTNARIYGIVPPFFSFLPVVYGLAKEGLADKEYRDWLQASHFDLVIYDGAGDEVMFAMAHLWKARVIRYTPWSGLCHFDGPLFNIPSEQVSGMPILSGFYPQDGQELGVLKRMINYVHVLVTNVAWDYLYLPGIDRLMRYHEVVPKDTPPLQQLIPQVTDLVMVTYDTWSHFARPLPPNVVTLAPMVVDRILKTKPLPKDIQDFIGTDDFIYASFGTFVDAQLFPKHLTEALLQGFGDLPLKVLFKWDDLEMPNVPPNIMLRKFYPQVDVLGHPNIKLYLQHGGFNGFVESIVHKVPSVLVPIVVDMDFNAFIAVRKGFGKKLEMNTLTRELVRDTILEVLHNKSYKENVEKYSAISRQDDHHKRETALNLINRLLDGEDLQHLKSENSSQSIWAKELLDVLALLFFLVYGTAAISLYGCYRGCRRISRRFEVSNVESKIKKEK